MLRNSRYYLGSFLKKFLPQIIKKKSLYKYLSFNKVVSTRINGKSLSFQCHAEEISNTIFYTGIFGDYEGKTLKMWHDLIFKLNLKTAMDIGAFSGIFSLTAAYADPKMEIYAYEPNPFSFKILKKNCELNDLSNIKLHNHAVANHNGTVEFYNFGDTNSPGMTSVNHRHVEDHLTVGSFEAKDILKIREEIDKKVDLLKLDIERAELSLLKHAKEILEIDRPILFCEVLDASDYENYQNLIESLDYGCIQINDDDHTYFDCKSMLVDGEHSAGRNWIFYPNEMQAMILAAV